MNSEPLERPLLPANCGCQVGQGRRRLKDLAPELPRPGRLLPRHPTSRHPHQGKSRYWKGRQRRPNYWPKEEVLLVRALRPGSGLHRGREPEAP